MKAAYINQPGPPESIIFGELPTPDAQREPGARARWPRWPSIRSTPTSAAARWRCRCRSRSSSDAIWRASSRSWARTAKRFKVGDRVWGSCQGLLGRQGTFAEYAAVDESCLYAIPDGVSDETAAACALVGSPPTSAWSAMPSSRRARRCSSTAAPAASARWSCRWPRRSGPASSPRPAATRKWPRRRELGADLAINYKTDDVPARVKEFAPDGINVWWETLREPDFDRTVSLLAPRGRMILMAGRDARPPFPVGPFYVKGCKLFGFAMFNATTDELRAAADDINRWLAAGKIKPCIDRVLPLAETATAHKLAGRKHRRQERYARGEDRAEAIANVVLIFLVRVIRCFEPDSSINCTHGRASYSR